MQYDCIRGGIPPTGRRSKRGLGVFRDMIRGCVRADCTAGWLNLIDSAMKVFARATQARAFVDLREETRLKTAACRNAAGPVSGV